MSQNTSCYFLLGISLSLKYLPSALVFPKEVENLVFFHIFSGILWDLDIFTVLVNVLGKDIHLKMAKELAGLAHAKHSGLQKQNSINR